MITATVAACFTTTAVRTPFTERITPPTTVIQIFIIHTGHGRPITGFIKNMEIA
jgi:hypothetical protein